MARSPSGMFIWLGRLSCWIMDRKFLKFSCSSDIFRTMMAAAKSTATDGIRELAALAVKAPDGTPIFYRVWATSGDPPKDTVVVIPGIGLHGLMYQVVAEALSPHGYLVIAVDLRGHGHSGGDHGSVPTAEQIHFDLDSVLDDVRLRYRPERLYLIGESMGGLIALNYIALTQRQLDGVVFVAAALRLHPAQIFQRDSLRILRSLLFSPFTTSIDLAGDRLDDASLDEDFKAHKRADFLTINRMPLRYLFSLSKLILRWPAKARKVLSPALVMHGGLDRVLDWRGSRKLHRLISASDKTFIFFPTAHHTLFWDPASPQVFRNIAEWLDARKVTRRERS